jgi:hypothetical protein
VIFIRKNSNLLFAFILPVFFFIVQNSIQNKHSHFYSNGIVVTHSHPVNNEKGSPINDHKHSEPELCLFQNLHIEYYTISDEIEIDFQRSLSPQNFFIQNEKKSYFSLYHQIIPRAPPV